MGPPIYDGKIHPNEYVKKMRVYCNLRQITNEQEILKFAITMIDSTINIPENINSFDTLINTLKNHISFTVFKNSCKRKLQALKYISEYEEDNNNDNALNFITDFRTLCRDAEITNIEEQKKYLINALPYNFFKNEFVKHKNANSTDELTKTFEEIVSDYSRIIKNGSIIALRHIGTGKYLSSCDKRYPQQYQNHNQQFSQNIPFTNVQNPIQIQIPSFDYMVYCGDFGPNALWSINSSNNLATAPISYGLDPNSINYESSIQLQHKILLGKSFYTNIFRQSPTSKHFEACCGDNFQFPWSIKHYHNHDNKGNVKSGDIILLQWNNNNVNNIMNNNNINNINFYNYLHNLHNNNVQYEHAKDIFLRSHDLKFTVDNENYQEVVTHDQRIGGNDQWCIELIE
ncbi:uncharacterized protein OCT59_013772 [Rhizophagus irregularis]|uniref:MIR domain-containing protein n=1 Tax=Rhizophagus irregularis (strain DAOM 181602 / DAOM 197198 / MUCL 43194) TaxID=747089 RepID=U9T8V4_RHIID|nr:hypothetical protein GLOIN_2v1774011 [Rhizophagus irregularis DAOM 181602=DAOM 197198]POG72167.1 hypothetical protein GLOIN_2v1774011 [Rhizophagus irregularis DAOM 181602=DAOM 197198]UZO21376.1 hypothetical protein OCT59_013772 [Rhizophagus irregularis]GBC23421.2 hypothetical protein GLOIN_2v1774011 [Rhizophagus irregularis DAOM 181602=DAOM 197198]|eukprot:XP_025179033.1 hypothetical protein GLOIN_2v1774011 [Rhizophagus irregularis DAOM 181602=DAOM 197198]